VDLEGTELKLNDGGIAFIRDGNRKLPLKCMPSRDAEKMDTYIKFLKRR
jgi:hypothetical protein